MLSLAAALLISTDHAKPQADAVRAFIRRTFGTSDYRRADADLNGDGRKEVFAYIMDPAYCGSGGCTLVVLSPAGHGYRVVMRSSVTRLPVRLLATSTHGWRDIGVGVSGGGIIRSYEARMRFNGRRYPDNPTVAPAIPMRRVSGKVLIAD